MEISDGDFRWRRCPFSADCKVIFPSVSFFLYFGQYLSMTVYHSRMDKCSRIVTFNDMSFYFFNF